MALTKDQMINYNQRSVVHSKAKEFWNYVTGSAGGWPTLSRAGILAGLDFTIESGSNEVKFFENNTNMYYFQHLLHFFL